MEDDAIPKYWRLAGIASAIVAFLLMGAVIHISTYDVHYGTRVWAEDVLQPGRPAALRVAAVGRGGVGVIEDTRVSIALVATPPGSGTPASKRADADASNSAFQIVDLEAGDTGFIEDVIHLPRGFEPGPYSLEIRVASPAGGDEIATFPIRVAEAGPRREEGWAVVRPVCEESSIRRPDRGWHPARRCSRPPSRLHLYPDSGHLIAHRENRIHLWVASPEDNSAEAVEDPPSTERVAPDTAEEATQLVWDLHKLVRVAKITPLRASLPGQLEAQPAGKAIHAPLDALGMSTFAYEPSFPRGALRVGYEDVVERVWLRDIPSHVSLEPARRLLLAQDHLELNLEVGQPNRPVLIEVWGHGKWIGAHSGRVRGNQEGLGIPLGDMEPGLLLVSAGLGPDAVTRTFTAAWIDAERGGRAVGRLAQALSSLPLATPLAAYSSGPPSSDPLIEWASSLDDSTLDSISISEAERLAAAMLSRVEPGAVTAPLLGDTTGAKLRALEEWKASVRRPILALLILLAGTTLFSAGWLVVSQQRLLKRRLLDLELEETHADEELDDARAVMTTRWIWPSILLGLVIVSAVVALIFFLETLRWNRGDVFAAGQRDSPPHSAPPSPTEEP